MSAEADFLTRLRALATHPAARGLMDDAAVLEVGGERLVLTHDMIVEGVHFLSGDPGADVAWKLLAVNLSDLAAKGARPLGVLMGFTLRHDPAWEREFLNGLGEALAAFGIALLGGDTVTVPADAPRSLGLTAIGAAGHRVPSRTGATPGDLLWVSGTIGDAHAGLRIATEKAGGSDPLVDRYRLPRPRLEAGQRLAPLVTAMMDVSDGLLLDAARLGHASGVGLRIDIDAVPLSDAYLDFAGSGRDARLAAATGGDDYELLFTAPHAQAPAILALAEELALPLSRIGAVEAGAGIDLRDAGAAVTLPSRLGYEHR